MTLTNIITRILERANRSGDTTLDNAITYALETVQDEIINEITFPELLTLDETTLLFVANQQEYSLPDDFDQMIQIWDTQRFNQELKRITPIEYKTHLGDITGEHGTNPIYYDILGSGAVTSTYRKKIKFFPYPSTILNGTIASIANYGATVAGTVLATDVAHGLSTGDSITISGCAAAAYNGVFEVTVVTANTFYFTATWGATDTGTWIKNYYMPMVYMKSLAYLSTTNTENALSYMYPQLYIEGGLYYLFRDYIYRDQPEKIAFRKAEFKDVKEQVKNAVCQPDYIRGVLPKRLLSSIVTSNRLYRTQYNGYTS